MLSKEMQRLRWQCRRGLLELDYLLESYLDDKYQHATMLERELFAHLLDQHDLDLQRWLLQDELPEDKTLMPIIESLRGKN